MLGAAAVLPARRVGERLAHVAGGSGTRCRRGVGVVESGGASAWSSDSPPSTWPLTTIHSTDNHLSTLFNNNNLDLLPPKPLSVLPMKFFSQSYTYESVHCVTNLSLSVRLTKHLPPTANPGRSSRSPSSYATRTPMQRMSYRAT